MRNICERHNEVIKKLRQRLTEADHEGEGRPQWKLEQRDKALDEAKAASLSLAVELKILGANKKSACQDVFNEIRKGGDRTKPAPSEKLFWFQQAQATFAGRTPEQALELYEYQLKRMTPEEKLVWRFVFDDGLELATFGDTALEFQAAQVIDKHRTPDERSAIQAMQKAERFEDFVPTLKGIFEANLQEAKDGDTMANDPAVVYETIHNDIEAEFAKV